MITRRPPTVLAAATLSLLAFQAPPASACPADAGGAPSTIKTHFCATWDSAPGGTIGSPLNDAHRWGAGWIRDFAGGSWGRGGILEGDGIGFAYVIADSWWPTYVSAGGALGPLGYPQGVPVFGATSTTAPRATNT